MAKWTRDVVDQRFSQAVKGTRSHWAQLVAKQYLQCRLLACRATLPPTSLEVSTVVLHWLSVRRLCTVAGLPWLPPPPEVASLQTACCGTSPTSTKRGDKFNTQAGFVNRSHKRPTHFSGHSSGIISGIVGIGRREYGSSFCCSASTLATHSFSWKTNHESLDEYTGLDKNSAR